MTRTCNCFADENTPGYEGHLPSCSLHWPSGQTHSAPAPDAPAERQMVLPREYVGVRADELRELREQLAAAEARAVRCEGALTDYAALVEVAQGVNTSLRLLPLTGIDDAQHIYDSMYKILDRLARWLIDTPDYPGKPAPREIPSRP